MTWDTGDGVGLTASCIGDWKQRAVMSVYVVHDAAAMASDAGMILLHRDFALK